MIEKTNLKRSNESLKFAKQMAEQFGFKYEKDYDISIHLREARGMVESKRRPWTIAYQEPNTIRLDDGNQSATFLIIQRELAHEDFMKVVEFVADYLGTTYDRW